VWQPVLAGAGTFIEIDEIWEVEALLEWQDVNAIKNYMESS
jgi:hypothetical protein